MKSIEIKLLSLFIISLAPLTMQAQDKSTKEATALFNKVYDMVFGEKGSSLTYKVNIIGLYKTQGNIQYKGKKIHYEEPRYMAWEDGIMAYMVDTKKKTVDLYDYNDDKKDEYLSKFKYDVNNFNFSYKTEGNYYLITAKLKNAKFFGIREVTAKVQKSNLYPVALTIKLAIFHTTVQISNFKSGGINDSEFVYPKAKFTSYKFTDHRAKTTKKN